MGTWSDSILDYLASWSLFKERYDGMGPRFEWIEFKNWTRVHYYHDNMKIGTFYE